MKTNQKGFTLIELMIVVAIIGILAAVAIPAFQNYIADSKAAAAYAEVAGGKTTYELNYNSSNGTFAAADTTITAALITADAGLQGTSANCAMTGTTPAADGSTAAVNASPALGALVCQIQSPGRLGAAGSVYIGLQRTTTGAYTCYTVGMLAAHIPDGCTAI